MSAARLRVVSVEEGLVPAEKVVRIWSDQGERELVVGSTQVEQSIPVAIIKAESKRLLVELPGRETSDGAGRVWVSWADVTEPAC